jgi:hypothetical protein
MNNDGARLTVRQVPRTLRNLATRQTPGMVADQ